MIAGSSVSGKVLRQGKSKKVPVVKFKRRQNYLRQGSHRQFFTEVEITGISAKGAGKPAAKKASEDAPKAKKAAKKKAAKEAGERRKPRPRKRRAKSQPQRRRRPRSRPRKAKTINVCKDRQCSPAMADQSAHR